MRLLNDLILLANTLDEKGFHKEASSIDNLIKEAASDTKRRFWNKVIKTPTCWIWTGAFDRSGYPMVTIGGKNFLGHRLSWEWGHRKKIPPGYVIRHKCNNKKCVRPTHLRPGTQQSNIDDRVKADRSAKGEQNGRAKLTKKDIKVIKRLKRKGMTEGAIAKLLGVSRSSISHILHQRSWAWI